MAGMAAGASAIWGARGAPVTAVSSERMSSAPAATGRRMVPSGSTTTALGVPFTSYAALIARSSWM
jgi:hypothetical protein